MRASAIIIQRKWRATLSARVAREKLILKVSVNKNQPIFPDPHQEITQEEC